MRHTRTAAAHHDAGFSDLLAPYDRVALLLQGGGALGAYHVGVWDALTGVGIEPDWISGVSIGAINAAIIAGNPPEKRIAQLESFWNEITRASILGPTAAGEAFGVLPALDPTGAFTAFDPFGVFAAGRAMQNQLSGLSAMMFGQPGFFRPRFASPWFAPRGTSAATSYYDTSALKRTLEALVDFDLLNDGPMRVSVGAVEVETGNFEWFDSKHPKTPTRIDVRHIMASGALPPALPAVDIDGRHWWDGGIVSNTPLEHLLDQEEDLSSLVFQVDLFPAQGPLPQDMSEVMARHKDIMYSSRTRAGTTRFRQTFGLRRRLLDALARIPKELRTADDEATICDLHQPGVVDILHVIYRMKAWESDNKDYEFSARSAAEHRAAGFMDMTATLKKRDWFTPPSPEVGVATHDIHAGRG
ncbi:MAG: patatin-like phospholipase family protein [Hyphomicrobiales bacterium]|nr:patatin-like phospholipase family protein [Hyphomicrobiales bacterium]